MRSSTPRTIDSSIGLAMIQFERRRLSVLVVVRALCPVRTWTIIGVDVVLDARHNRLDICRRNPGAAQYGRKQREAVAR